MPHNELPDKNDEWFGDTEDPKDEMREVRARFAEHEQELARARSKQSDAWRDFYLSVDHGKTVAYAEEIVGIRDDYGVHAFTDEQAIRAAGQMRSETAAILAAQAFILQRLDRNRNFMYVIIVMLFLILFR